MQTRRESGPLASHVAAALLSACGGGAAAEPPATSPEAPTEAKSDPAPVAEPEGAAGDKGGEADKSPEEAAPADLGEGDTRTTEAIAAVVKAHRKEARDCYEKAAKQIKGLKGDVVIHFTLTPSGKVKTAELNTERSTITEASVSSCVIDVLKSLEFPKSSKGLETTVNYPYNFTP